MSGVSTREYRFLDQQQELLKRADELVGECETAMGLAGLLPNIRSKRFKPVPPARGMPRKTRRDCERLCLDRMNAAALEARSLAADLREFLEYGDWPADSQALRASWRELSTALESGDPRGILHHALRFDDLDGMAAAIQRLKAAVAAVKAASRANAPARAERDDKPRNHFLAGDALADALGVHPSRRAAFYKQLNRKRRALSDDAWQQVSNPRPNMPQYLYRTGSLAVRTLAARYATAKPA